MTARILTLTLLAMTAGPVSAEILRWDWTADESQIKNGPLPDGSTDSEATGSGYVLYSGDTNQMTVSYTWNNLFGELTKLHIHGPATAEQNNPQHVIETFGPPDIPAGVDLHNDTWTETFELQTLEQEGFDPLSPEEIVGIMTDGLSYVNIHTSVYGTGEIRGNLGQPRVVPEPGALALAQTLAAAAAVARRRV